MFGFCHPQHRISSGLLSMVCLVLLFVPCLQVLLCCYGCLLLMVLLSYSYFSYFASLIVLYVTMLCSYFIIIFSFQITLQNHYNLFISLFMCISDYLYYYVHVYTSCLHFVYHKMSGAIFVFKGDICGSLP